MSYFGIDQTKPKLYQHYDFSDTGSVTTVSGLVSQIDDLSGNDYHATQTTASLRPNYVSSAQNGLHGAFFDGDLGEYLATSAHMLRRETVFCVFNPGNDESLSDNQAPAGGFAVYGKGSTTIWHMLFNYADNKPQAFVEGALLSSTKTGANPMIVCLRMGVIPDVECLFIHDDETPVTYTTTINYQTPVNSAQYYVGIGTTETSINGATPADDYIFEIKRYSGLLSETECTDEIAALNTKWAIF